jgi:hypothetical protein
LPDALVAPAFHWVPEHLDSYGPEVADWADSCGLTLDAEQRLVLDAMYAAGPGGQLVATETGLVCQRQNLKTHVLKAAALADLFLFDEPGCMWTAQLRTTSLKSFEECKATIDNYDHLRRYVRRVVDTDGEEAIELLSGASLEFRTRSGRGGRGLSGRRLTLDEALYLTAPMLGALVPVLSAQSMRADVQLRYASSAGKPESAVLRGVRDRGRAGGEPRMTYTEWTAPQRPCATEDCPHVAGADGCALDDLDLLQQANPALGRRISPSFVLETERRAMTPQEFMRERLGWWEDPVGEGDTPITVAAWTDAEIVDAGSQIAGEPTLAVDVPPDRSSASLAVAGLRSDGLIHGELVDARRGTGWAVAAAAKAAELHGIRTIVLDAGAAAGALVSDLEAAGLTVVTVSAKELGHACGGLADKVVQQRLRHLGQPELTAALEGARTRNLGDGAWAWHRRGSTVDISPLVAVTLAVWQVGVGHEGPSIYEERDLLVLG